MPRDDQRMGQAKTSSPPSGDETQDHARRCEHPETDPGPLRRPGGSAGEPSGAAAPERETESTPSRDPALSATTTVPSCPECGTSDPRDTMTNGLGRCFDVYACKRRRDQPTASAKVDLARAFFRALDAGDIAHDDRVTALVDLLDGAPRAATPASAKACGFGCPLFDAQYAEVSRLRNVIRTGGAMYRAERAVMGIPGGIDPDPRSETPGHTCEIPGDGPDAIENVEYDLRCAGCVAMRIHLEGPMLAVSPRAAPGVAKTLAELEAFVTLIAEHPDIGDSLTAAEREKDIQRRARALVGGARSETARVIERSARCRVCGHYETDYDHASNTYAHCPSCNRAPHWLRVAEEDSDKPSQRSEAETCGERTEDGTAECVQEAGHEQRGMAHSFRQRREAAKVPRPPADPRATPESMARNWWSVAYEEEPDENDPDWHTLKAAFDLACADAELRAQGRESSEAAKVCGACNGRGSIRAHNPHDPEEIIPCPDCKGRKRKPRIHVVKCWKAVFPDVKSGRKPFEYRLNDRDYQVGDCLIQQEYDPDLGTVSDEAVSQRVTYLLPGGQYGIPEKYCILAVEPWDQRRESALPRAELAALRKVAEAAEEVTALWREHYGEVKAVPERDMQSRLFALDKAQCTAKTRDPKGGNAP